MKKICIIGAGISGVSLAYYLSCLKKDGADIDITVIDAKDDAGGCIQTVEKDGYQVESGPSGFMSSRKHMLKLISDAGLFDKLISANKNYNIRYIERDRELRKLPSGPLSFFTGDYMTMAGKKQMLKEPWVKAKQDNTDETVYSFAERRLGKEAATYLVSTMVGGILAGDATKISVKSAFPAIYELENSYGGLFRGVFRKRKSDKKNKQGNDDSKKEKYNVRGVLSYNGGMQAMVKDLAAQSVNAKFIYNCNVKKLTKSDKFKIETDKGDFTFDEVAICCPSHQAKDFVAPLNEKLATILDSIVYAPVFIAGLGYDKKSFEKPLKGFGYLVPPSENRPVLGTIFSSITYPNKAPKDKVLLTVISAGDSSRGIMNMNDTMLTELAHNQTRKLVGAIEKPEKAITFRWDKALPQYYIGHSEKADEINSILQNIGGLYLGGNSINGVSITDCVKTSMNITQQIKGRL